uniref:tryptophan transporter n=1 Tax=Anaerococcus mediterraneensis TaxID=1870984 RepID=UPI0009310D9B|nr:tryptophan transporter [Anaerococcus mediterraneensis]
MKTQNLTISAVFMALGLVMHFVVPGIFFGVKPDFLLSMMFMSLLIVDKFSEAILIGVAGAIMSALTTTFPGGQVPNFIEKIITTIIIFKVIQSMNKNYSIKKIILVFALGTLISGTLFLTIALSMTKQMNLFLPSFPAVLVAMVINPILGIFLYKICQNMKIIK